VKDRLVEIVRRRRRELGWTQRELARAVRSSASRSSKLEHGDASVSLELVARCLEAMSVTSKLDPDDALDPLRQPGLTEHHRAELSRELLRRRIAARIAEREGVDPDDVRHALANLELEPLERLRRMFQRARLHRRSVH